MIQAQKCPVCDGAGLVSKPPWVADDVQEWVDILVGLYPCKACNGIGIVYVEEKSDVKQLDDK